MNILLQNVVTCAFLVLVVSLVSASYNYDRNSLTSGDIQRSADLAQYMAYIKGQADFPIKYESSADGKNPSKRFKLVPSGRSGGVSLCLWKVCPAAPWLVSKRSRKRRAILARLQPQSS